MDLNADMKYRCFFLSAFGHISISALYKDLFSKTSFPYYLIFKQVGC